MPEPTGPQPLIVARIVHAAMAGSILIFGGLSYVLQQSQPRTSLPSFVVYMPLVLGAAMFAGALMIRTRLLEDGPTDLQQWWRSNLSRAVLLWSLFEGPALFGAAIYLASGQAVALGATAAGFILLVLNSPDRLHDS
ncbi:MAG: hypothetical protein ABI765_08265 [Gemmatimonadota bacterium]